MLTPQRDSTAIRLQSRLAVVNTKLLVLEAQRTSYGVVNEGCSETWPGHLMLQQLAQERKELEAEIAKRG